MSNFNPRPVLFPSGGSSAGNPRRPPSSSVPQFHPPHPSSSASGGPALPFMSFDISAAAASTSAAPPPSLFSSSASSAPFSSSFEDEPPLLEELGINTRQIWRKSVSILNPIRIKTDLHSDADLSGPFIFLMAFGLFQLLAGKFHFGIILGWVTISAMFLYFVFNMLLGRNGNLDLYRCVSLVGYCMLPMVIFSSVSLFLPKGGAVIFGLGFVFVGWSTRVCTRLLAEVAMCGDEHRGLVAYACWLVFCLFSLLVIF